MDLKRKGQSLKSVFFKYLFSVGIALLISVCLSIVVFNSLFLTGQIAPANYIENNILKNKTRIAKEIIFDAALLPQNAFYLFLSKEGKVLKSNMNEKKLKKAIQFHNREEISSSSSAYIEIDRSDGVVVINYSLLPFYTNRWIADHFPSVNMLFALILIVCCLIGSLVVTLIWAKKLTRQLNPMIRASKQIAQQDLDFEMEYSKVNEFNIVLKGLDDMKQALSKSLKNEWIQAENRKNQISSLAHDLKTPISIVQGNTQLLSETEMTDEQKKYVEYILKNANRISDYVQIMMEINETDNLNYVSLKKISCIEFANKIVEIIKEFCIAKKLKLKDRIDLNSDLAVLADMKLLERAIYNVLSNASEYTPKNSSIDLEMESVSGNLIIRIMDQGCGFTEKDLLHASEQFYQGNISKGSSINYGLGLYNTNQIMNLHNGKLKLENKNKNSGAIIILELPIVDILSVS